MRIATRILWVVWSALALCGTALAGPPETAEEVAPPAITDIARGMAPIAGTWLSEDETVEFQIPELGDVTKRVRFATDGFLAVWSGTGVYGDDTLSVWVRSGRTVKHVFRCKRAGDVLDLTDEKGATTRFRLQANPDTPPATTATDETLPPREKLILGKWHRDGEDAIWRFAFHADGRFDSERVDKQDGSTGEARGTYAFEGETIRFVYEDADGSELIQGFHATYRDAIEIIDSKGAVLRIFRVGADLRPGGPANLPGTWASVEGSHGVHLLLEPDGRMIHQQRGEAERVERWGRYRVVEAELRLYLDGEKEMRFPLTMPDANTCVLASGQHNEARLQRIGGEPAAVPAPTSLVGTWEVDDEGTHFEVVLRADGSFTNTMTEGGESRVIRGAYEFEQGRLVIRPEGDEVITMRARLVDADHLEIVEDGGDTTLLVRKPAPTRGFLGRRTPRPPTPGRMVGTWLVRTEALEIRIVLRADATYTETVRTAGGTETTNGRYEWKDGVFLAHPEGDAEAIRLKARFIDDDTLELLDDEGNGVQLKRQG